MYSGGSGLSIDIHFVDIELSYDVLSPLPTLLSKHFNHPHPYIEIATAISDYRTYSTRKYKVSESSSSYSVLLQYKFTLLYCVLLRGRSNGPHKEDWPDKRKRS